MTRCERFKNFKIVTTEEQVDKQVKNQTIIVNITEFILTTFFIFMGVSLC